MYRKFLHIILAILFLGTTSGFSISTHYCEGKLVAVNLSSNHLSCCSVEEGEEDANCCDIDSDRIHLTQKFIPSQNNYLTDNVDIGQFSHIFFSNLLKDEHLTFFNRIIFQEQNPPPLRLSKILAKNQSYLL